MSELSSYGKEREEYAKRRREIEREYYRQPLNREVVQGEGGAKTLVLSKLYRAPEHLIKKSEAEKDGDIRISVYLPGIWELEHPNTGNTVEVNLLSDILLGKADAIVVAKAEGLNREAYASVDANGKVKGEGQRRVAVALAHSLERQLGDLGSQEGVGDGQKPKFVFNLTGYSEGASQAVSTALLLQEFGRVESVTAIAPAGLIGAANQEDITLTDSIKQIVRNASTHAADVPTFPRQNDNGENLYHQADGDTLFVDASLIGGKKRASIVGKDGGSQKIEVTQGFEGSLGETAEIKWNDDLQNVLGFFKRLVFARDDDGAMTNVPAERVKAVLAKNKDYDNLMRLGIDLTVISGTKDGFFPFGNIENAVAELRNNNPDKRLKFIAVVNGDHGIAHYNPNGVAFLSELAKGIMDKSG